MLTKPRPGTLPDPTHPLMRGLTARWLCNEGNGTTIRAMEGPFVGTISNGPRWIGGSWGSAVRFNGSPDAITVPYHPNLNRATGFTWVVWVKVETLAGGAANIMQFDVPDTFYHTFYIKGSGKLGMYVANTAVYLSYDGTGNFTINPGVWYQLAATYGNEGIKGYVNSRLDGAAASAVAPVAFPSAVNLEIGSAAFQGRYLTGAIGDIAVYGRALTAYELYALYVDPYGMYHSHPTVFRDYVPSTSGPFRRGVIPLRTGIGSFRRMTRPGA